MIVQERINYNFNVDSDTTEDIADPKVVWGRYSQYGSSVRLLHPQRWSDLLADALAKLEDVFSSCVGCNAYLTPGDSKVFLRSQRLTVLSGCAWCDNFSVAAKARSSHGRMCAGLCSAF